MNKTITLLIVGVIFLALLLIVLNSFSTEEQGGVAPPSVAEKARPQREASPSKAVERIPVEAPSGALHSAVVPGESALSRPPALSPDQGVPPAPAEGLVAVKTVPAQIDPGLPDPSGAQPGSSAAPRAETPALPRASAAREAAPKRATGTKNITNVVVFATQEGATLRLAADHPLLYKPMLLSNPDRLVLDLEGQWNMSAPAVPQNRIIKAVRVGRQAESTRVVIDLQRSPASYRLIKTSPQGLDIRVR